MTAELGDADPRPVVRWASTTADSGTGVDPLRTCLHPLAELWKIAGRVVDVEGYRPTMTAVEV